MNTVEKPTRRLADLNIGRGTGDGTWSLIEEWFETDDAEFSIPFTITESFEYQDTDKRPKYGFGIEMEGDDSDGVKYYISFPAADKSGKLHKERTALYEAMQQDTTPIAGCVMQRIDTGKSNPFVKIISVEAMEQIIESESDDESEDD